MEEIAGRIQWYQSMYQGCLAGSICCMIPAAALYFVLDIRSVLGYLTGMDKRRRVRQGRVFLVEREILRVHSDEVI